MELKVGSTLFNSSSGGGGTFYMGRGDKDEQGKKREEQDETGEMGGDELAFGDQGLARDGMRLPPRHRSFLSLGQPAPIEIDVDPEEVVAELESAIQIKMKLLSIAVTRMEAAFERRLRAEIGDVVIGA